MRKIEGTYDMSQNDEIRKHIDSFPKDVFYTFKLKKLKLGSIWESHHVTVSVDMKSKQARVCTDFKYSADNAMSPRGDELTYKDFDKYEDAEDFIYSQIPEECWQFVGSHKEIIKD
jgi:hypothetical protein